MSSSSAMLRVAGDKMVLRTGRPRFVRLFVPALALAALLPASGCTNSADSVSCMDFLRQLEADESKADEIVLEAYKEKYPDESAILSGRQRYNAWHVQQECERDKGATVDEFIERDAPEGW